MTKPLSNDLRARLIDAVAHGMSCRAAADRFGVAASTAVKLVRRWRDTGTSVQPLAVTNESVRVVEELEDRFPSG